MAAEQMRYTTIKIRLHPTQEQAALMEKTFGCCRYLWNKMLSDVQEFYAATDLQYIPTPSHYKKEAPFLKVRRFVPSARTCGKPFWRFSALRELLAIRSLKRGKMEDATVVKVSNG